MTRSSSRRRSNQLRAAVAAVALVFGSGLLPDQALRAEADPTSIPNNLPVQNPGGHSATFSTEGSVDLVGEYFQAQGSNGRSCGSCHIPQEAWSINPGTLQRLFDETDGTHPVFNPLDANNPLTGNFSTVEGRRAAYSMLLSRGVFRRGGALRTSPAVEPDRRAGPARVREPDPARALAARDADHQFPPRQRDGQLGRREQHRDGPARRTREPGPTQRDRRPAGRRLPTFPAPLDPPFDVIIPDIVGFENSLFTAQLIVPGVGRLDSDGARGGPEAMASMTKLAGRFDLFDAWADHGSPAAPSDLPGPGAIQQSEPRRTPVRRLPQLGEQRHQHQQHPLRHRHRVGSGPHPGPAPVHVPEHHDGRDPEVDRCGPGQRHRALE